MPPALAHSIFAGELALFLQWVLEGRDQLAALTTVVGVIRRRCSRPPRARDLEPTPHAAVKTH